MSTTVDKLVRHHLEGLQVYEPIEPPEVLAKRLNIPVEKVVKLDGNENPYGPSTHVEQALAHYREYHIYPDPFQQSIREAIAAYTGLETASIVAGSGCDEVIDLLLRLTLNPGDQVIDCVPTFGMYAFCTRVCGGTVVPVERDENFQVNLGAVKAVIGERTKAIFLCSPNNPTGNLLPDQILIELLGTGILVVVDETYHEFSKQTFASWVPRYENLVVLRTFSKWAGLAALRIGYGLMSPALATYLMAIKSPYNVNGAAEVALIASLQDRNTLLRRVDSILGERDRLFGELQGIPGLSVYPSAGNFILCRVISVSAAKVYQDLVQRGIFVRYFNQPRLEDYLRITVGKPEQNEAVVAALHAVLS